MTTANEGFLHLLCGKMASGKSTLAAELVRSDSGVLLSEDDLLARLYPEEIVDVAAYVRFSARIKDALRGHLVSILDKGLVVVLDFPANTLGQRSWLLRVAQEAGVGHILHYLECSDAVCIARLDARRADRPERRGTDTVEMFHAVTRYFQPPDASEGVSILHHV